MNIKNCLTFACRDTFWFNKIDIFARVVNGIPAANYMFKVDNRNTRTRCQICSKLTMKTPERRQIYKNYQNFHCFIYSNENLQIWCLLLSPQVKYGHWKNRARLRRFLCSNRINRHFAWNLSRPVLLVCFFW